MPCPYIYASGNSSAILKNTQIYSKMVNDKGLTNPNPPHYVTIQRERAFTPV